MAKKKTHKRSWKWENMKLNMRKVPFERKWIVRLNRPNSSSVTQGSIMQLTQTKPSKASRWVYATATTSALVSQRAAAQREPPCWLQALAALCWPCARRALLCPQRRIPLFLSLPAFPAATSTTICAGSRTAEDMFFTLLIYGPDSRRKLPRFSPSQPQLGEYRCS